MQSHFLHILHINSSKQNPQQLSIKSAWFDVETNHKSHVQNSVLLYAQCCWFNTSHIYFWLGVGDARTCNGNQPPSVERILSAFAHTTTTRSLSYSHNTDGLSQSSTKNQRHTIKNPTDNLMFYTKTRRVRSRWATASWWVQQRRRVEMCMWSICHMWRWRYTPARQSRHVFLPHIDASNSSHMLYVPRNKCMWFFASVLVNSLSPAPKSFRIHCVLVDGFSLTQELNLNDA